MVTLSCVWAEWLVTYTEMNDDIHTYQVVLFPLLVLISTTRHV